MTKGQAQNTFFFPLIPTRYLPCFLPSILKRIQNVLQQVYMQNEYHLCIYFPQVQLTAKEG